METQSPRNQSRPDQPPTPGGDPDQGPSDLPTPHPGQDKGKNEDEDKEGFGHIGNKMTLAVAHAVSAGIGLASLPRSMFKESAFTDVLCPVLTEHPLRQPHLYAIYASRKYLPLKLRTFVDHLIEWTRIPPPWGTAAVDISIS